MDIKIPKIKIIRTHNIVSAAEEFVQKYLIISAFISPFAIWKLLELVQR